MPYLFDLDGTLTDPKLGITTCIRHAMAQLGRPLDAAHNLDFCIGPPLQNSFAALLGNASLVPQAIELYRERFKERGMFENEVYAGIPEALAELSKREALYVATSKPRVFAEVIVRHFGLAEHFRGIYGSELDGQNSDKTALIAKLLADEKIDGADATMIGDREHDMIGAKNNGLRAWGVAWGYGSQEELMGAGAAGIFMSPSELANLAPTSPQTSA